MLLNVMTPVDWVIYILKLPSEKSAIFKISCCAERMPHTNLRAWCYVTLVTCSRD